MSNSASGADIFSCEDTVIGPGEIKLVSTGFAMAVPSGFEGQIRPRSGLALKHGITVLNTPGTVDSDYRGEVKIILINLGKKDFAVKYGDRIAQLVITEVARASFQSVEELDETQRQDGGFGHTGL
jgi:dUTP pyrophosphatase